MFKAKLFAGLALSLVAGAASAVLPTNVFFDNFCDGITGITLNGTTYVGTYNQSAACGGPDVPAAGPQGRNMAGTGIIKKGGAFMADTYPVFGVSVLFVINEDKTFTIYDAFGGIINTGTWTAAAGAQRGRTPALSGQ
jgi:hypothetical protein